MRGKRTAVIVSLVAAAGVVFAGYMYFAFWREPKATYVETNNPKLISVREDLDELIADLKKDGRYNCCIRNDCKWCAIYMGHCPCADLVLEEGKEKSCPECAAAWNRKQGKIPGVDPEAIQVTTFGIYGYEKSGHHAPGEEGEAEQDQQEEKGNHH